MLVNTRGFNLTELILTLFIIATLVTLAIPGLRSLINEIRVTIIAHEVENALLLTRSEAIQRNQPVTMEAIAGNWINGWTIQTHDGLLIRSHDSYRRQLSSLCSITFKHLPYFTYGGNGRLRSKNSPQQSQNGTIFITSDNSQRQLILNLFGRIRHYHPANPADCLNRDADSHGYAAKP